MGHHDIPTMPRTPALKRVISMLGNSLGGGGAAGVGIGSLPEIADATLDASDAGLQRAKSDEGVGFCIYLMTQLTRASASEDFMGALQQAGLSADALTPRQAASGAPPDPANLTVYDLVSGFSATVDRHLRQTRTRSDISELAQLSAAESISALCSTRATQLFGPHVQEALRGLSTRKGFGSLAQDFFARLTRRYIEYHLGRELSDHVGVNRRFKSAADHNQFLRELDDHCRLATKPISKFAGEWYSLHNFQDDISLRKAKGFAAHAIDKVRDALRYEGGGDVD